MKNVIVIVILALLGAGGAMVYLKTTREKSQAPAPTVDAASLLHGNEQAAANAPKCAKHGIPQAICAFCDPSLIEKLGFCHGHGVPEAFCTRCSAVLIPAFKAEGDWCQEHGLPESQCAICKGQG